MSDFKAGAVAVVTLQGASFTAIRVGSCWHGHDPDGHPGEFCWDDEAVTDVRQLVVLDLEDCGFPTNIVLEALRLEYTATGDRLAQQIEAQVQRPKPPEPLGDGAVVVDTNGYRWVRIAAHPDVHHSPPWRHRGHAARYWDHVNAVKVLSEGVA